MQLWIAVNLPRLALDALHPPWPLDATACAVVEHECVMALTPAAASHGIVLGMRRAGATALAPHAILLDRDVAAEGAAMEGAALALLQYTPEVALGEADSLLLNVGASLRIFGGPRALARRIAATLAELGLQARLGMAPTAGGAWLLARRTDAGPRHALALPRLARRLDALPCALLPQAQPHLEWLHGIGCRQFGFLRRLPRAGLQRRCGPALLKALDAAYGQAPEVHAWISPPAQFKRRFELIERIEHADAVLAVARKLIEQMSGWLTARQRAVPALALEMEHERGRHARPPSRLELTLAEPAWQPAHLLGLLRERLGRMTLEAPVIAVVLEAPRTVPQPAANATLFPEPAQAASEQARLLDLLTSRLGETRVLRPCPAADHRPEVANRWTGVHDTAGPGVRAPVLDRPFWLLDPPQPLQVRRNRPVHGTPLTLVRGPERIESGWWDEAPAVRDYFVAEDADAARYWIYRERGADDGRWFLHGLFG
ncbi:Y-family DNA polymerase [Bordetella genomosp. 9]|uniref:DNA polymerase n=1 Tax=Bordetella genomosp. 9 TaxID=1416803 RepID=A0A1W6Z136_9BORD|nr:DNA polymerase Y family protein [Bordetella genomosp. 9]ARP87050.1 DNA polymerase [Bordetella genomosp. 9]